MKKIARILLLLALPLLIFTGCKEKRPSLDERIGTSDMERVSYEGMLEALDQIDIYQQGTHQLSTEDDGIVILQSPTIDLNRYVGEEVLVKGEMEKGIGNAADVFTVNDISYVDERLNQKTKAFENQQFGFLLQYPENWQAEESGLNVILTFEEDEIVRISVFSDEEDLDGFAANREETEATEVTIGAQRALRYVSGQEMRFYVPNPPKRKIYRIEYSPSINAFDEPEEAESQRETFYDLLESLELIYMSQVSGDACGGLKQVECPEEYICQLEDDSKYAEGICVPIGGSTEGSCPYIAPPSCEVYRISEYSLRGCPSRYECVEEGSQEGPASFRDLNVVDEAEVSEGQFEEMELSDLPEDAQAEGPVDYDIPEVEDLTFEYVNGRMGYTIMMPKTWYFTGFGAIDGTLYKTGFSNQALDTVEDAIITLSVQKEDGGISSRKIDDLYYVMDGARDLRYLMEAMLDSLAVENES